MIHQLEVRRRILRGSFPSLNVVLLFARAPPSELYEAEKHLRKRADEMATNRKLWASEHDHHHQRTWPSGSDGKQRPRPFSSLPISSSSQSPSKTTGSRSGRRRGYPFDVGRSADFSDLPFDVLRKIAAPFSMTHLWAMSGVCRSWREGLQPLREAVVLLRWGKRFKHGTDGVRRNVQKALDCFLKAAARGYPPAMVDAGLIYWETGDRERGIALYREAALLGDPSGQCNLGLSYLHADPPDPEEATNWFYQAACAGNAKWYLKAAKGGNVRAMYNIALCYSSGQGMARDYKLFIKWMKRAAECGHSKAQFEYGLNLFSEGNKKMSLVYFELALRSGERNAAPIKDALLQQLSPTSRDEAMSLADNWVASHTRR